MCRQAGAGQSPGQPGWPFLISGMGSRAGASECSPLSLKQRLGACEQAVTGLDPTPPCAVRPFWFYRAFPENGAFFVLQLICW